MAIKWEVGKKYRTERGTWAICAAVIGPHPVSGDAPYPIMMHHENGDTYSHTTEGVYDDCGPSAHDIIGEWVDPLELVVDVLLLQSVGYPREYSNSTSRHGQHPVGCVGTWYGSQYRVVDVQTVTLKHTPEAT